MKQNAAEIANIKINAAVAAHVLGISSVTFSKMISTGVLKRADPKKGYRLGDVVGAVVGHYQRLAGNRSGDAGHERSLASARAASALAQADERRLRVGILRGRYVSRASVRRAWETLAASFRETALSIPGKIAYSLSFHTDRDREAIEDIVRREIFEMLEIMSGGGDAGGSNGDGDGGDDDGGGGEDLVPPHEQQQRLGPRGQVVRA